MGAVSSRFAICNKFPWRHAGAGKLFTLEVSIRAGVYWLDCRAFRHGSILEILWFVAHFYSVYLLDHHQAERPATRSATRLCLGVWPYKTKKYNKNRVISNCSTSEHLISKKNLLVMRCTRHAALKDNDHVPQLQEIPEDQVREVQYRRSIRQLIEHRTLWLWFTMQKNIH